MEDYVLMTLLATLLATPCVDESGQLTLLSGAGEGEVVSKEVGEEEEEEEKEEEGLFKAELSLS